MPGMGVAPSWCREVFGADWADLTASHVGAAAAAGTRRSDLAWLGKRAVVSEGADSADRLACFLAALANTGGGLAVIGVDESVVDPAMPPALAAEPFPLDLAYDNRIMSTSVTAVVPRLYTMELRRVYQQVPPAGFGVGEAVGLGYYLVAVGASPLAPHACVREQGVLRYPITGQDGTSMRFMMESEVADLYRDRAALAGHDIRLAVELAAAGRRWRAGDGGAWLDLALSPARATRRMLDGGALDRIRSFARGWGHTGALPGVVDVEPFEASVARRRVRLRGRRCALELYVDGGGYATVRVDEPGGDGAVLECVNDRLELATVVLLDGLARHAMACGVGHDAVVAACLRSRQPVRGQTATTVAAQPDWLTREPVDPDDLGSVLHTVPVVDVGSVPAELHSAARRVAADILADVGLVEPHVLHRDGTLWPTAMRPELRDAAQSWAQNRLVPLGGSPPLGEDSRS